MYTMWYFSRNIDDTGDEKWNTEHYNYWLSTSPFLPDFTPYVRDVLDLTEMWLDKREVAQDILYRLTKAHPEVPVWSLSVWFRSALEEKGIVLP